MELKCSSFAVIEIFSKNIDKFRIDIENTVANETTKMKKQIKQWVKNKQAIF